MKLSYAVCCTLFVAVLIGHSTAASINQPGKSACGSNATADYKGACDESVPVIVMPKGRPIMERVLDWFKCDNEECQPESSEEITTPEPKPITTGKPRPVPSPPSEEQVGAETPKVPESPEESTTTPILSTTTRRVIPSTTIQTTSTRAPSTTTPPPIVGTGTAA